MSNAHTSQREHAYTPEDASAFDPDCAKCGGKHRDSIHGQSEELRRALNPPATTSAPSATTPPPTMNYFTATRALAEHAANKTRWTGGSIIVETPGGFQAIPVAYSGDASYTGSREALPLATVRAAAKRERATRGSL